ncbi:MAG: amidase family protein [Desulfitobacteriaceae bacterium]
MDSTDIGAKQSFELIEATIPDIRQAIETGQVTSRELVECYLERIHKYDSAGPNLNSIIATNPKALELANDLDKELLLKGSRGPLHGIPVILKDNIETADMPTTGGNLAFKDFQSQKDSFLVKRLREAGAIILAKANLHELARSGTTVSSLGGQTRNPYDLSRTPGGSSGGTGAAIAANLGAVGLGTDTLNSIRSPASANSLVGIRPTMGLLSRDGIIPAVLSQDTAGPLTRSVTDAAILLDVMAGYDSNDPITAWSIGHIPKRYVDYLVKDGLQGKRLGVLKNFFGSEFEHQEVNKTIEQTLEVMTDLGANIVRVTIPGIDTDKLNLEMDLQVFEGRNDFNSYLMKCGSKAPIKSLEELITLGKYEKSIEKLLRDSQAYDPKRDGAEYKERLLRRGKVRQTIIEAMANYELTALVFPHQKRLVSLIGEPQLERNGILGAVTGFPSIVVPAGFSHPSVSAPLGVPVGLEFFGRPWSETILIEMAYSFEQATRYRCPPISTP